jgi:electron-transferring-flavoprotein dehydrogenase
MTADTESDALHFDVIIVGAGPSGLSAAIRLKQQQPELEICVLEKGSEVGAHILSGAVLDPSALAHLFPDYLSRNAPLVPVTHDHFYFLTTKTSYRLPVPSSLHNQGNYIISLGSLCRWLAEQATMLGVQLFAGFPAKDLLFTEDKQRIIGIKIGEFGRAKDSSTKSHYQPSLSIYATYTLFAEGCRGSLSEQLIRHFDLRRHSDPQTYGIGIKELWEIDPRQHRQGQVWHSVGWPLDRHTYGGSFVYFLDQSRMAIGYVIGLDYQNPYLSPFEEFQRFKTHPLIRPLCEGGKRLSYGARALNEGGYQSIPELIFPGGALIGCSAGFLNVARIKGTHNAMWSGIHAANSIINAHEFAKDATSSPILLTGYKTSIAASSVYEELKEVRNIRPMFRYGLFAGLCHAALQSYFLKGREPWTLHHHKDHEQLNKSQKARPISYPKPDQKITFDRLSSVYLSNTNHEEDQPCHLHLKDPTQAISLNWTQYQSPEQHYCPAGVYEIIQEQGQETPRLQINAQNCLHCKTCDIKDPGQNIEWRTPEGGGGPNYGTM